MARATDLKDRTDPGLTASAVIIGPEATLSVVDRTAQLADWAISAPPAINRSHYLGWIRPNLRIQLKGRARRHPEQAPRHFDWTTAIGETPAVEVELMPLTWEGDVFHQPGCSNAASESRGACRAGRPGGSGPCGTAGGGNTRGTSFPPSEGDVQGDVEGSSSTRGDTPQCRADRTQLDKHWSSRLTKGGAG